MTTGQYESSSMEAFYVKGADGKMYMEAHRPGGGYDYVAAETGLSYREIETGPNSGKYLAVRDAAEARRQAGGQSHLASFGKMASEDGEILTTDPRVAKRKLKKLDALEKQIQQVVIDRIQPGPSPMVRVIKDSEFERLHAEYAAWVRAGSPKDSLPSFTPLTAYARKLVTKSGTIIRHALAGEVGMQGDTILTLERGYGTGDRVSVSEKIGG